MFDKLKNSLLEKMVRLANPDRDFSIENIGGRRFAVMHDTVGCNYFVLEGTYTYDEVLKINEVTNYSCGFGFCPELGPIAFIGIPNSAMAKSSGYFISNVVAYGDVFKEEEHYFNAYTDAEASKVSNYTVYGNVSYREVSKVAKIKKLNGICDSRYKDKEIKSPKVIDMDCKVKGFYDFNSARLLATGTTADKESFCGDDNPIVFAKINGNTNIGIINLWPSQIDLVRGFRTVWEFGKERPSVEDIIFLSKEEASKIKNYELYIYKHDCAGVGKEKYEIEKYDRTLDKRFDFHLPDGNDYRLVSHEGE